MTRGRRTAAPVFEQPGGSEKPGWSNRLLIQTQRAASVYCGTRAPLRSRPNLTAGISQECKNKSFQSRTICEGGKVVKIRMKMMGRKHRRFFRICAMDSRSPRDGRAIEELGIYDPMVPQTDQRYRINKERVEYWLSVGAQPTEKVSVLLRKSGIITETKANTKKKRKRIRKTPTKAKASAKKK